jgi:hypothetical protein
MIAVLWKEVRVVWLWWYFGREERAGSVFLEEEKRREVGRALKIFAWLEMDLIAIAANAEHLPFLFAWTCSKKARGLCCMWPDEETSVASFRAKDTGIVYNASNTSTNKRREPISKHFASPVYGITSCVHQMKAGYELDGGNSLSEPEQDTATAHRSIIEFCESSCLIIKVALE